MEGKNLTGPREAAGGVGLSFHGYALGRDGEKEGPGRAQLTERFASWSVAADGRGVGGHGSGSGQVGQGGGVRQRNGGAATGGAAGPARVVARSGLVAPAARPPRGGGGGRVLDGAAVVHRASTSFVSTEDAALLPAPRTPLLHA
jgi:hypothetical protein